MASQSFDRTSGRNRDERSALGYLRFGFGRGRIDPAGEGMTLRPPSSARTFERPTDLTDCHRGPPNASSLACTTRRDGATRWDPAEDTEFVRLRRISRSRRQTSVAPLGGSIWRRGRRCRVGASAGALLSPRLDSAAAWRLLSVADRLLRRIHAGKGPGPQPSPGSGRDVDDAFRKRADRSSRGVCRS